MREILFLEKLKECDLVVKTFDYEIRDTEDEHMMFVLMEKGEKDLNYIIDRHRKKNNLTGTKVRYFWEQMLEAVHQVHEHNIVHADLKPLNFLLVKGELKVIDFGLAGEIMPGRDHLLRSYMGGTKNYMSPEAMSGYIVTEGVIDREAMKNHGRVLKMYCIVFNSQFN